MMKSSCHYCSYCGSLLLESIDTCSHCKRKVVRRPAEDNEDSDLEIYHDIVSEQEEEEEDKFTSDDFQNPPDHQDMIYGYVERYRGEQVHTFHFRKEVDGTFILAASMAASKDGPIFFHTKSEIKGDGVKLIDIPRKRGEPGFIACLVPTGVLGTEFLLTSKDESPYTEKLLIGILRKSAAAIMKKKNSIHEEDSLNEKPDETKSNVAKRDSLSISTTNMGEGRELGLFQFDSNLLGTQPNSVKVTIRANPNCASAQMSIKQKIAKTSTTRIERGTTLFERLRGKKKGREYHVLTQNEEEDDELAVFETKKPQWNEEMGGWTLDFNGRITISSKKNFILVPSKFDEISFGSDTTGVRFGKVSKHRFNLDFRFPFSPLAALAIGISMFTSKLIVAW